MLYCGCGGDFAMDRKSKEESQALELRKDKYMTVVQKNDLIRLRQEPLTVLQTRLLRLVISKVAKSDKGFSTYTVSLSQLSRQLNMPRENLVNQLYGECKDLMKKVIILDYVKDKEIEKKRFDFVHWVERATYKDGVLTIRLSEDLHDYLIDLDKWFTQYEYETILQLPTANSGRLYEVIKMYLSMKDRAGQTVLGRYMTVNDVYLSINELRQYTNCTDTYKDRTSDFLTYVVKPAVKAISEKTDIHLKYSTLKEGKFIRYVVLTNVSLKDYNEYRQEEARKRIAKSMKKSFKSL